MFKSVFFPSYLLSLLFLNCDVLFNYLFCLTFILHYGAVIVSVTYKEFNYVWHEEVKVGSWLMQPALLKRECRRRCFVFITTLTETVDLSYACLCIDSFDWASVMHILNGDRPTQLNQLPCRSSEHFQDNIVRPKLSVCCIWQANL